MLIVDLKWSLESSFFLIADNEGEGEKDVEKESVILQKR